MFGKTASDLQSNVVVGDNNVVYGTLNYVSGYTGFSSDVNYQAGNYLALYVNTKATEDAVVTVELIGGDKGPVTLDDDHLIVMKIANTSQSVKVTASDGTNTVEKTYTLTGLTLKKDSNV